MMKVAMVHPDLGLGGAERLVVDAALSLIERGHNVIIYTGYHDPDRAFPETIDGSIRVVVVGSWIPRHICGRGHAFLASVRNIVTAFGLVYKEKEIDVVICDQVATSVPILRWLRRRVLFYVHFPDKLLAPTQGSVLRKVYRWPLDKLEEFATSQAHALVVNSKFTANVFADAFPSIKRQPRVLYPCIQIQPYIQTNPLFDKPYLLSLNRYERKKRLDLAIDAYRILRQQEFPQLLLVIAGGYDPRLRENVEHFNELQTVSNGLEVIFERSISNERRQQLISHAACLLYTPPNEHFGIVPLEAMALGCPVIACNSGGPLETVQEGDTGFLVDATPAAFATAVSVLLKDPVTAKRMRDKGPPYVQSRFARSVLGTELESILTEIRQGKQ